MQVVTTTTGSVTSPRSSPSLKQHPAQANAPDVGGETLAEAFAAWRVDQVSERSCDDTAGQRIEAIERLGRYAGGDPRYLAGQKVREWVARVPAQNSKNLYGRHAKTWFTWLHATGRRPDNPLAGYHVPRAQQGVPRPIGTDQLTQALMHATGRLFAWLILAAYMGLRCFEIAKLRGEDFSDGRLTVLGKNGKIRVLPVHPAVKPLIRAYPRRGYWFPSSRHKSGHVSSRSVSRRGSAFLKAHEIDRTMHTLRHWFGTRVVRAKGIRVGQVLLGHSKPETTALYALVEDDDREAAILALPDLTGPAAADRGGGHTWTGAEAESVRGLDARRTAYGAGLERHSEGRQPQGA